MYQILCVLFIKFPFIFYFFVELRAEIERLRAEQGGTMNEEALAVSLAEIARLKAEMEDLSRSWQERLKQAEAKKAEELQQMEVITNSANLSELAW